MVALRESHASGRAHIARPLLWLRINKFKSLLAANSCALVNIRLYMMCSCLRAKRRWNLLACDIYTISSVTVCQALLYSPAMSLTYWSQVLRCCACHDPERTHC